MENKQIIDTLKFLLLYDDMLNKKYNPSEYQEVYQRKISYDEIEKKEEQKKYDNQMVNELLAIDKNIKKNSLCIFFNNIHIGEYDSEKNGFPIYEEPWNYSAGMPKKLYYGKVGKIVLTNTKDNVFPKFLACDKKLAKSVLDEFKYIEVGIFPTHRERVCCAYVGFIPQRATIEKDESNEEVKVIYGKGNDFVLFTTEEGSIIRISLSGDKWKQE